MLSTGRGLTVTILEETTIELADAEFPPVGLSDLLVEPPALGTTVVGFEIMEVELAGTGCPDPELPIIYISNSSKRTPFSFEVDCSKHIPDTFTFSPSAWSALLDEPGA